MSKKAFLNFLALTLIFYSHTVFAQSMMDSNMLKAQTNLMQFAGKWVDKNPNINIGGRMYGGEYFMDFIPVNENTGMLVYEKWLNDEFNLLGVNLVGYDPNAGQVHLYSIDNTGTAHDHYGYWIDDKHLFLQYQGVVDGKMYVEQINVILENPEKFKLKLIGMLNGEIYEIIEGAFVKSNK